MSLEAIEWSIKLAILTAILGALGATVKFIHTQGYNEAMLEIAARQAARDADNARRIMDIQKENNKEPLVNTVVETVEVIRHVDRFIDKPVYVCNDLGDDFIRVRNKTRECIFKGGSIGDCLE